MLVAHASSTCDVCLESYTENCSYHTIPCGHVFCLPCLVATTPTRCPLCRHEFSPYTMRKLHLTLPSSRDLVARKLEMKLVQSSPEMTLADSLTLFQEVQDWLEGEAEEEFVVLRAFAAVLCSFHETKDKLLQNQAIAERNEDELKRLLEEARSAPNPDAGDYKTKYRAVKTDLANLRAECAELRAQAEQQRNAEYQAHLAQIQTQAQLQVQAQSEAKAARRISNPLPTPPRPVEIPFLKFIESRPSSHLQVHTRSKGKGKEALAPVVTEVDPMASAFVPTLSTSIPAQHHISTADGRAEVTTLVFKPPKRMPIWHSPSTSFTTIDGPVRAPPQAEGSGQSSASQPVSDTGASVGIDPVPAQSSIDPVLQPKALERSEPYQRPRFYSASRPLSYISSSDQTDSSHGHIHIPNRVPSPDALAKKQRRDPRKHCRESHPISTSTSQPAVYPVALKAEVSMSPVLDPLPTPGFARAIRRPAWQGGTATGPRRASSPVVVGDLMPVGHALPAVTPLPREAEDPEDVDGRGAVVRSYGLQPAQENHRGRHHRRPTPQLDVPHRSESHTEPEPRVSTRGLHTSRSPVKTGKEATTASRHPINQEPRSSHGQSHSLNSNTLSHLPRVSSPMQSRSHDDLQSQGYPALLVPFPSGGGSGTLYPGEESSSNWHLSGNKPRIVPVGEL